MPNASYPRSLRKKLSLGCGLLALVCLPASPGQVAAEPLQDGPRRNGPVALGDDELVLDDVFQSHLPTTLKKYSLRLSVHPRLGDWQNNDHMRLATVLRYGLTDNCELSAGSNLYFSHGHGDIRAFEDNGAADFRFGAKFDLGQFLFNGWDTGAGLDYTFPFHHPPAELTDGLRHSLPYLTFSHRLKAHPNRRIFVGLHGDIITRTSWPGTFSRNAFHESSSGLTGGWVIDRGNLHYTFEASFDTTRIFARTEEDLYTIRPGLIWEIPTRRDPQLMTHWQVGVALNDTYGPGGNSMGASLKVRYSQELKRKSQSRPTGGTP
jgi:hypothetical protein